MDADLSNLDPEDAEEVQRILGNGNTSHGAGDLSALSEEDPDAPDGTDVE